MYSQENCATKARFLGRQKFIKMHLSITEAFVKNLIKLDGSMLINLSMMSYGAELAESYGLKTNK